MALCENEPANARQVNISGMSALIQRLANTGAFIVFLSTNQVFSGERSFELPNAAYQPMNEYGRQKAEMENWIKANCDIYAIVRLTKVVEQNMSLVKSWIDKLMLNQPIDAFHDMPLAPVSLRQVLDTLITIGQKKQTGSYQISGALDISYFDLANYLATCLKRPTTLVQSVSALNVGIKKIFLPRFTTLDCSSTIALGSEVPPHFSEVLHECFDITE
jgi:dTDP-4-dehydrorhamnose reductase